MGIHDVAGRERSARAARVDVIDLRAAHQVIEGVALQRFRDLQAEELDRLLEQRMLDRHLRNVGDGDLVTPLQRGCRNLADGHDLADGRHALGERRVRQRHAVITGCGVGEPAPFGQRQRVAKLVNHQLPACQRQRLIGNIGFNVSLKG